MDKPKSHKRAPTAVLCILLLTLSAANAVHAQANSFPPEFRATFLLNTRGIDVGTTQWELGPLSAGRYFFSIASETIGIAKLFRDERVQERSEWELAGDQVRPLRYSSSRVGGKREREMQIDFDWSTAKASSTLNGNNSTAPLKSGTLDKLTYFIALMNDLSSGVTEARYAVADGEKSKTYLLKVVGEEQIDTVLGPLNTTVVERTQSGKSRVTRMWCAQGLQFLPVQIEHIEDDGTVRFTLTALEGLTAQ
jgi:hypothetical protein